jgi:hypothetical protein
MFRELHALIMSPLHVVGKCVKSFLFLPIYSLPSANMFTIFLTLEHTDKKNIVFH